MVEITVYITFLLIGVSLTLQGVFYRDLIKNVKKGNKDQQEIKTRLAWIKKRQKIMMQKRKGDK